MTDATTRKQDPFHACADFIEEVGRVLNLSMNGVSMLSTSVNLIEALAEYDHVETDGPLPSDVKQRINSAYQIAELARSEVDREFPLMHAHAAVALWSSLESTFPKFVVKWLDTNREALRQPPFDKILVPIGVYEGFDQEERTEFIVDELLKKVRYNHLPGVGRFEAILETIGFGGGVPDDLRKTLFELGQVRNLAVHQFSIVDQHFVDSCPWIKVRIGERFTIGNKDYMRYHRAAVSYLTEVIHRVVEKREG